MFQSFFFKKIWAQDLTIFQKRKFLVFLNSFLIWKDDKKVGFWWRKFFWKEPDQDPFKSKILIFMKLRGFCWAYHLWFQDVLILIHSTVEDTKSLENFFLHSRDKFFSNNSSENLRGKNLWGILMSFFKRIMRNSRFFKEFSFKKTFFTFFLQQPFFSNS